jgi:MFS superfamily sulfate permease-like transporter
MRKYSEIPKFLITYIFTVVFDVSMDIILCILMASLVIIRRSTSVNISLLGEIKVSTPGSQPRTAYVDLREHPEASVMGKVLAIQLRGSLEFFNASRIARRIEMLTEAVAKFKLEKKEQNFAEFDPDLNGDLLFIRSEFPPDSHVAIVLDFSLNEDMDSAAVWVLIQIIEKSKHHHDSQVYITGIHSFHRDLFERAGLVELLGSEFFLILLI